jgi:hypothetical protein
MQANQNTLRNPDTFHFNVGNVGSITLASPGVATPAALAFFGQINIGGPRRISVCHLHLIEDGSAPSVLNLELWRRRSGTMTRLCELQYVAPVGSDFITIGEVPADSALLAGDYLFVQAVTGTTLSGGGDGLTVDVHYRFA